ncbi:ABC transporter permease [Mesorhizobium sp. M8A.F.Ca.ET.173.01.1.1]|nr:ABC transporter permease [Mesorhizobium sp. M8A.F.Ca.ET.173.01.1.1]
MGALVTFLLGNPTLVALFASIVGGIAWGFRQRVVGARLNQAKHDAADARAASEGQHIDDVVAGRSPDDNRKELGQWAKS